jgi:hypothetical protein
VTAIRSGTRPTTLPSRLKELTDVIVAPDDLSMNARSTARRPNRTCIVYSENHVSNDIATWDDSEGMN